MHRPPLRLAMILEPSSLMQQERSRVAGLSMRKVLHRGAQVSSIHSNILQYFFAALW